MMIFFPTSSSWKIVILGTLRYVHHCRALVFSPFPPFLIKYLKEAWYFPSPLGKSVKVKGNQLGSFKNSMPKREGNGEK